MDEQKNIENVVKFDDSAAKRFERRVMLYTAGILVGGALAIGGTIDLITIRTPSIEVQSVKSEYTKVTNYLADMRTSEVSLNEARSKAMKDFEKFSENNDLENIAMSTNKIMSYDFVLKDLDDSRARLKLDSVRLYDNPQWREYRSSVATDKSRGNALFYVGIGICMLSFIGGARCQSNYGKAIRAKNEQKTTA